MLSAAGRAQVSRGRNAGEDGIPGTADAVVPGAFLESSSAARAERVVPIAAVDMEPSGVHGPPNWPGKEHSQIPVLELDQHDSSFGETCA